MKKESCFSIEVIKQPVARVFINYYWLPMLVSLLLFIYYKQGKPDLISVSYYIPYFLGGGLTKSFLQKRIVNTFVRLRQTGALPEPVLQPFVKDFQMQLDSRLGDILGIVGGLIILGFYLFHPIRLEQILPIILQLDYLSSATVVMVIDVLLGYAIGVAIWKIFVTAREIRRLILKVN